MIPRAILRHLWALCWQRRALFIPLAPLLLLLLMLPVAGVLWFIQGGHGLTLLLISSGCATLAALLRWRLARNRARQLEIDRGQGQTDPASAGESAPSDRPPHPAPDPAWAWSGVETRAWQLVNQRATAVREGTLTPETLAESAVDMVREIAGCFHPDTDNPVAEITVPEVLLVLEHTLRDLRRFSVAHFPLVRSLHIGVAVKAVGLAPVAGKMLRHGNLAYAVVRGALDVTRIPALVIKELADQSGGGPGGALVAAVKVQVARDLLRALGRSMIDLYSGRLRVAHDEIQAFGFPADRQPGAAPGPVEVTITGGRQTGKRTLARALGELIATDGDGYSRSQPAGDGHSVIACNGVDIVRLHPEPQSAKVIRRVTARSSADAAHVLLWVTSAVRPARDEEVAAFRRLQQRLEKRWRGHAPPLLVVVTHVDQLNPKAEWSPPYELDERVQRLFASARSKARTEKVEQMKTCVRAISETFGVSTARVVPVALPPAGGSFNLDVVWAAIASVLPESRTRMLGRLVLADRSRTVIGRNARVLFGSGRLLLEQALPAAPPAGPEPRA